MALVLCALFPTRLLLLHRLVAAPAKSWSSSRDGAVCEAIMAGMMRALLCQEWGGLDRLSVGEAPIPAPKPGEVLIRVKATAINYADSIMVAGRYQTKPPFPFSPGLETAGIVADCGPDVTAFRPGERVMAILPYGGLAEFAIAPVEETYRIPDGMSFAEAGAFPVAYMTPHVAIRWQGRLESGETLLVLGAGGGTGLPAIEIGKALGARVIAGASTPDKLALALAHGADAAIDYASDNLTERVMALTDGKGVDCCFDPVGGPLFDAALSSLGWGGRILLFGFVGGIPQIPANRLLVKNRAALGCSLRYYRWHAPQKLKASVAELFRWYGEGRLKLEITQRVPLERAVEGLRLLTERRSRGKIIVEMEAV